MRLSVKLLVGFGMISLGSSGQLGLAQPSADGLIDDSDLQVQYAVFGADTTFKDVTESVSKLVANSPGGFFPKADTIKVDRSPGGTNQVLIFYNFQGHAHFAERRETDRKLSLGLLKEEAKVDDSKVMPLTPPDPDDGEIEIKFAVYGALGAFNDETENLRKLLHDPDSKVSISGDSMNGDPIPNVPKSLVIIYDCDGHRHLLAIRDGHDVTLNALKFQAANDSNPSP